MHRHDFGKRISVVSNNTVFIYFWHTFENGVDPDQTVHGQSTLFVVASPSFIYTIK